MSADPNGCGQCGISEREHLQRWKPPVGWHVWTQPTQDQIKARMLARRASRPDYQNEPEGAPTDA